MNAMARFGANAIVAAMNIMKQTTKSNPILSIIPLTQSKFYQLLAYTNCIQWSLPALGRSRDRPATSIGQLSTQSCAAIPLHKGVEFGMVRPKPGSTGPIASEKRLKSPIGMHS